MQRVADEGVQERNAGIHHFVQDDGVEASSLREGMRASELRTEKLSG